jgi:hypothetical protein
VAAASSQEEVTLDASEVEELRRVAGARSLSAAVNSAVAAYLAKWRHPTAVDDWLTDLECEHGPVPAETWSGPPTSSPSPPDSARLRLVWADSEPIAVVLAQMRAPDAVNLR